MKKNYMEKRNWKKKKRKKIPLTGNAHPPTIHVTPDHSCTGMRMRMSSLPASIIRYYILTYT